MVLKEVIHNRFLLWEDVVVLKEENLLPSLLLG